MDQLITLTIDDREVSVLPGTSVLDAAGELGIEIPTMCHYARLTPVGACRLCLVEIEKVRDLQPACATPVRPEMVVHTDTPETRKARAAQLEFLLTNHPLDCPICDKGGECDLQDQVFAFGGDRSRFIETKRQKSKARILGEHVIMDQERCVLCRRCIRFMQEWAADVQLGVIERGAKSYVDTFDGEPLDSPFTGNVVQVCPVGALTSRHFRFSARSWELNRTDSVCMNCAAGCNISLHTRANQLKRIVSRENPEVNDEWLCNRGQFDHSFVNPDVRLTRPLVRRGTELQPATWDEALTFVAQHLASVLNGHGGQSIGLIGSPQVSNEGNYLLQRLARAGLRTNNVALPVPMSGQARLLSSLEPLKTSDLVLIVGMDLVTVAPILELFCRRHALANGTRFVLLNQTSSHLDRFGASLHCDAGTEIAVLNGLAHQLIENGAGKRGLKVDALKNWVKTYTPATVQKATGVPSASLRAAAAALTKADSVTILYGGKSAGDEDLQRALSNLALLMGAEGPAYVPAEANAVGAVDMGAVAGCWPDGQPYSDQRAGERYARAWGQKRLPSENGMTVEQMISAARSGALKAAHVLGTPPASLEVEFLVVQSSRLEDAAGADVALPACTFAESEGTYTNLTGRVQVVSPALYPLGESQPDWWILTQLGARLGKAGHWTFASADQVFSEIARCLPSYAGMTYRSLSPAGNQRKRDPGRLGFAEAQYRLK